MTKRILGMVLASLLLLSCALEPTIQAPSDSSKRQADLTLFEATYTFGFSKGGPLAVGAKELAFLEEQNEAVMNDLTFTGYDEGGKAYLQGRAENAVISTDTYDAHLKGGVEVQHLDEDIHIFAEELLWSDEQQTLRSSKDTLATIIIDEEITLTGLGLMIDFTTLEVRFEKIIEGTVRR